MNSPLLPASSITPCDPCKKCKVQVHEANGVFFEVDHVQLAELRFPAKRLSQHVCRPTSKTRRSAQEDSPLFDSGMDGPG